MAIGINPTVDFAFKMLYGNPEHPAVTIHFLNSMLEGPKISQVEYLNPFQDRKYDEDKLSVLDIMAIDDRRRRLNIEMQSSATKELPQRLTFYNARSYVNQLTQGLLYGSLRQSISICVLNQPLFPEHPALLLDFRLRERSGLVLTEDLQIHLLELTKLRRTRENILRAPPVEQWAYFLLFGGTLTYDELCRLLPIPEFIEAAGILEMIQQTPEQNHLYSLRLKAQTDEASRLESTRIEALMQGRQEGRQEGRQQGRQEGEKEGLLKGRIEMIQMLQSLTGVSRSTVDELSSYEESQLSELAERLQLQLRNRGE